MSGSRISAFELRCVDVARVAAFFAKAFDGAIKAPTRGSRAVQLGEQNVALVPASNPTEKQHPGNYTSFQHFAIVVSDMARAVERLAGLADWQAISHGGPQALPARSGGVTALKFRDPEGHPLELLQFPEATRPAPWAGRTGLFLGIDHSAISVADLDRSIAFYGRVGLKLTGRQLNQGAEQARLDGLEGATVEIATMAFPNARTPHLELLHYRHPPVVVRPAPDGSRYATCIRIENLGVKACNDPDGHRLAGVVA